MKYIIRIKFEPSVNSVFTLNFKWIVNKISQRKLTLGKKKPM